MKRSEISVVVTEFYRQATADILIGYHFRNIQDFDEHIPKIVSFWELQLLGKTSFPKHLPFELIEKHRSLSFNRGQMDRWVMLFHNVLANSELPQEEQNAWKAKIGLFKERLLKHALRN